VFNFYEAFLAKIGKQYVRTIDILPQSLIAQQYCCNNSCDTQVQ